MNTPVMVIIPNYNGVRMLDACLRALHVQTYDDLQIVVVDNGSQDGSVAFIGTSFPAVRVIRFTTNRGFAAAINAGIRASDAPLIATLNNDAVPDPEWLSQLVLALEREPHAGMAASKMLFVEPRGVINSAGICVDRAGIAWDRCGGELDDASEREVRDVFGACAGAALYRRSLFDEIGPFDEDFFAYLEDVDLAWRAQLAGWRALYVPQARVSHWHSATSIEGSPFKSQLLGRNKWWTIIKNYPAPYLWLYLPLIVAYDWAAVCYALVLRRDVSALQGRIAALRGSARMWRKRKQVQSLRRVSADELLSRMQRIAAPRAVASRYAHLQRSTYTHRA